MRIEVPVAQLEFEDGGNTIWVHNEDGATVLRIKAGKVVAKMGCENVCAHADLVVQGTVEVCIP
jgi:hypothetical protein